MNNTHAGGRRGGWMTLALVAWGLAVAGGLAAGCAGTAEPAGDGRADFVLVYLKSGPTSGQGTPEARQALFGGHMANIKRLAAERKLLVAGPFAKPRDAAWRGLFIFDVATVEEAAALAATDPGVMAGEFVAEGVRVRGAPELRQVMDIEEQTDTERATRPANKPPPVRAYVLVHAEELDRAVAALVKTDLAGRVVWVVRLTDRPGAGVFALDAETPAEVARTLEGVPAGRTGVDGWWSTRSLLSLPATVRR